MKKNNIKKAKVSNIEGVLNILNIKENQEIVHAKKWHNLLIIEFFKSDGINRRYFFDGKKEMIGQIFTSSSFKWTVSTKLLPGYSEYYFSQHLWTKDGYETARNYFNFQGENEIDFWYMMEASILASRQERRVEKMRKMCKDAYAFKTFSEMTIKTKLKFAKAVINSHANMSEEANRIFAQKIGKEKYTLKCSICGHEHEIKGKWKSFGKSMTCPKCGHKSVLSNRNKGRRPIFTNSLFYWSEYKKGMVCLTGYEVTTIVDFKNKETFLHCVIPKERIIIKKDFDGKIYERAFKWTDTYAWKKAEFISSWKKQQAFGFKSLFISWQDKNLVQTLKRAKGFYGSKFVNEMTMGIKKMNGEDFSPLMFFDRIALEISNIGLGQTNLRKLIGFPEKETSSSFKDYFPYVRFSYKSSWQKKNDDFGEYFDENFLADKRLRGMLTNGLTVNSLEVIEAYVSFKKRGIDLSQKEVEAINTGMQLLISEGKKAGNSGYWTYWTKKNFLSLINEKFRPVKVFNYLKKQQKLLEKPLLDVVDLIKDYQKMSEQLGIALNQSIIAFPKNLQEAHDKRVEQINKANAIKKAQEARELARKMIANYPERLKKEYVDEEAGLLIRPFFTLSEIKREGIMQHHCIYSYHDRPDNLYVVRQLADPTTPYVSVEILNGRIVQARGRYNSRPTDQVNNFLTGLVDKGYFISTHTPHVRCDCNI